MEQTNLYAKQKKIRHWQDVTIDELRAFIAILTGMGLHDEPATEMFWSSDMLFRVQPIADIMPVKRYEKIRQALHINDNSKTPKQGDKYFNKLYKIRPIVEKVNTEFMQQCASSTSQSIDEAMVIFKGRSSIKQYMPLKPIKRGFKVWVRSDSTVGYMYQIDIYTGKSDDGQTAAGLGGSVKYMFVYKGSGLSIPYMLVYCCRSARLSLPVWSLW